MGTDKYFGGVGDVCIAVWGYEFDLDFDLVHCR
ncbi:hypothetical protein J2W51_003729 [Tardiphaga robiniae]|nr:hypothetical protein [Tardiphaga robiniae]